MSTTATDLECIRCFIESVIHDDMSRECRLWQGEGPRRALAAINRVIEAVRPIPVGARLPELNRRVLVLAQFYVDCCGTQGPLWIGGKRISGDEWEVELSFAEAVYVSHWLPMPSSLEEEQ